MSENGSLYTDAELDAMDEYEAWGKNCYAAWLMRRDIRKHELIRKAMAEAQAEIGRKILEYVREKL